ncbi:MAG: RNA polymerase sigma factor [Flavobacteriales bacterium]|nr:RNA polymerase sigma factor [Flavobacteriales bacterium]MBK6883506.1 RNA polymerase sigma factor [Flavobacteriales bacterium]
MTEESSFKDVYDRHSRMVYNLCLNYVQNADDAQELTQDVFVKVHEGFEKFRGDAALRTWIHRIAINTSLDHLKAQKRQKRSLFSLFRPAGHQAEHVAASDFDHPGVLLENREATARIFGHINALPAQQKTALLMKSMEGLSQNEIAEVMGVSNKAVESLLSRARQHMRKELGRSEG